MKRLFLIILTVTVLVLPVYSFAEEKGGSIDLSWLNLIITSIATLLIAFCTIEMLKINKRQHKLHYEQDLYLHATTPAPQIVNERELECYIACILVNPSKLPVVITRIETYFRKNEREIHFVGGFIYEISSEARYTANEKYIIPRERPERIYINQVPWVIKGDDFAIFSKKYSSIPLEYDGGTCKVKFYYRDYKTNTEISKEIELPLRQIRR